MNFNYVLLTIGKDKSRNKLVKIENINQHYNQEDEDVLVSLWQYGAEAFQYFQKNGTLTGYRGEMSINALPFDIDEHEGDISHRVHVASGKTKKLLSDLREKGITTYIISYSGSGGFHVMVPSDIFGGFQASSVLPAQMLALAKSVTTADFDRSIYSHLRMFRLYGTKHPKTKLFKIQIEEELLDYPDKIIELAKSTRDRFGIKNQGKTKTLVALKDRAFELVPEENLFDFDYKPKNKLCIAKLLEGMESGGRNEALCRITSHFKREGYSPDLAFEFVLSWNKFNKPPEDLNVLKTTFKSIWENDFSYGCYDWLLDSYCDKNCYLYRNKQARQEEQSSNLIICTMNDAKREYDKFVKEDRKIKLGISDKIDTLIRGMAPQQTGVILGRPGSLKSTIAMSIGKYFVDNYSGYFLYNSLEMSLAMVYERQMQINFAQNSSFIEKNYTDFPDNKNMERYLISDRTNISVKDMVKSIKEFEEKRGEKVELWIVDYLHAMKSEGQDSRAKIEQTVKELVAAARTLDTRLIYLAHVHRTTGGKDDSIYLPVKLGDGKDTSAIEDSAFFVFGSHLILDDPEVVVLQLLKNKHGEAYSSGVRLRKQNNSLQLKEEEFNASFD